MHECEGFLNKPYFLSRFLGTADMRGSYTQGNSRLACIGPRIAHQHAILKENHSKLAARQLFASKVRAKHGPYFCR